MEKMNDLRDLLKHEIADLLSAEEQIIKALPAMIENANDTNLRQSLEQHLRVTEQQLKRVEQIHNKLEGKKQESKGLWTRLTNAKHECKGMKGIIQEGEKLMNEDMDPEVKDAAIIAACQKVEHYEICGYGTAKAYAEELGLTEIARELDKTLKEEYEADLLLSDLAEARVNKEAESGGNSDRRRQGSSARVPREEMEMEMASSSRGNRSSDSSGGNGRSTSSTGRSGTGNTRSSSGNRSNTSSKKSSSSSSASRSRNEGSSRSGGSRSEGNSRTGTSRGKTNGRNR